jgi:hypothetical protein
VKGDQEVSKAKMIIVALIVSFALGAVAVSTASAADEWFVSGTRLVGSAAVAEEAKLDGLGLLLMPAVPFTLACEGPLLAKGTYIFNPAKILASQLSFKNCFVQTPAACTLVGTTITTLGNDLQGTVTLAANGSGARIAVKTPGRVFTEIELTGTECSLAGLTPIPGEFTLGSAGSATESATHALEGLGSVENNSSQIDKDKIYLDGKALVSLASGSKWSFHA